MKTKRSLIQVLIVILLMLATSLSPLVARVIASQTINIYAYIPERAVVTIDAYGTAYLDTNNNFAQLDVSDSQGFRILSIIAR